MKMAGLAPLLRLSLVNTPHCLVVVARTRVFTLGRHRTNDIFLNDIVASKFHARIIWKSIYWQNVYWLQVFLVYWNEESGRMKGLATTKVVTFKTPQDLGSNNGSFLNGKRLSESRVPSAEQECPLQINDHIIIGNTNIIVSRLTEQTHSPTLPVIKNEDSKRKSIFVSDFQPNLNHPIFHRLRESLKKETQRQKRKSYQILTQEEKEHRKRLKSQYIDRAAQRQSLYKSTSTPIAHSSKTTSLCHLEQSSPLSYEQFVPESRGKSLLKKMGWVEGQVLGREKTGIVQPLQGMWSSIFCFSLESDLMISCHQKHV